MKHMSVSRLFQSSNDLLLVCTFPYLLKLLSVTALVAGILRILTAIEHNFGSELLIFHQVMTGNVFMIFIIKSSPKDPSFYM